MVISFLFIGLIILGIFILITRNATPSRKADDAVTIGFGIQMTEEEIELERESDAEIMKLLEDSVVKSGYFRRENIPELMGTLRKGSAPFARVNTKAAFDGDAYLAVQEKRMLGLNTRMKYSKKFIGCFHPASFKTIEPKATLECMHLDAFHRVSRQKELTKLKKLGFIDQVKISPVGDSRDCMKIQKLKKIYSLNEVPELPLAGCDSPYCRCMYVPILSEDI